MKYMNENIFFVLMKILVNEKKKQERWIENMSLTDPLKIANKLNSCLIFYLQKIKMKYANDLINTYELPIDSQSIFICRIVCNITLRSHQLLFKLDYHQHPVFVHVFSPFKTLSNSVPEKKIQDRMKTKYNKKIYEGLDAFTRY